MVFADSVNTASAVMLFFGVLYNQKASCRPVKLSGNGRYPPGFKQKKREPRASKGREPISFLFPRILLGDHVGWMLGVHGWQRILTGGISERREKHKALLKEW